MGKRVQTSETVGPQGHETEPRHHPPACRRPPGRKPGPAPEPGPFGRQLLKVVRHCFPELNRWLDGLPDPRRQDLCVYLGRHLWWQIILTFLLRGGSRNAFDADRNTGQLPENMMGLCAQAWDEHRLGKRRTVTCSENAKRHAARVPVPAVACLLVGMVRRLMAMRLLDSGRLFGRWWLIVVDGTLQDRGRRTRLGQARYRYIVEAKLLGPHDAVFSLMTEFREVRNPVLEKEDCELRAFHRLAARLHAEFPRLPICLLFDGLYPVEAVFNLCEQYGWMFIATLPEGRQPSAWDEAVQTMLLNPTAVLKARRKGEDGWVEQTLRWTSQVPFGSHLLQVLFSGEISPTEATLWVWVTNFPLDRGNVYPIANQGGRGRQQIEAVFNVEKNGGFGLEHAFCANTNASQNYHLMMQVAHIIGQLLLNGVLRRLTQGCRKLTHSTLIALLRTSLLLVPIDFSLPTFDQIRFRSSA